MMNQAPRGSLSWLRLTAALPLFAGLLVAFGASARPSTPSMQGSDQAVAQGDPNSISVVVTSQDPKHPLVNGEAVAVENLAAYIEGLGLERTSVVVNLEADPETKMEAVNDVKDQLRKALVLKLYYRQTGADPGVQRRLPPPVGVGGTVTPAEALKNIDRNNILAVRINSADRILAGATVVKDDQHLLDLCKEFIRDHAPKAVISLRMDKATSYLKFFAVQNLLKQAYDEVRGEQARSRYGKAFEELDDAEREAIYQEVPMAISEADLTDRPQPVKR